MTTKINLAQFLTKTYHFSTQEDQTVAMEMGAELFQAGECAGARLEVQIDDVLRDIAAQLAERNVIERERMELLRESNAMQREGLEHSYTHSTWQMKLIESAGNKCEPNV